jgi:DUF4097 and DUF4098 domain-containing protein YvlB
MNRLQRQVTMSTFVLASVIPAALACAETGPTGRFDRTLNVSGPIAVSVSSGSGSVTVTSGSDSTVRIIGTVHGNSWWRRSASEEVAQAIRSIEANPPIVQEGSAIRIGDIEDREIARRVSISYEVAVPKPTRLTVKTGSGSQTITAAVAGVNASTGSGSVTVGVVDGPVEVRTGSGAVRVEGARDHAKVSTGSGSVDLGAIGGPVHVNTGSGSIEVREASGGTSELSTGSGRIEVSNLTGGLTANAASGSIRVSGTPEADWAISTSSGGIDLDIPSSASFRVRATTSSGRIETDHTLTVTSAGRRELSGAVGSGGPLVSARSASGSIQIGKR